MALSRVLQPFNSEEKKVPQINVAIADDHPMLLSGLKLALDSTDMHVVSQTSSAGSVVDDYRKSTPDVLVLDIRFGSGETGLQVAETLLAEFPDARVIFYSQFDQDELIKSAYKLGGAGFVTKDSSLSVLIEAIHKVHSGQTFFMPAVAERLSFLAVHGDNSPASKLTPRELQIFALMATGSTNAELVHALSLAPKTISHEVQAIKTKLGVHRPADITRTAIKYGLIPA